VLRRIVTAVAVTLTASIIVSSCVVHPKRDAEEGENNRQHTVTVSEEALPAGLAPLVKWLGEETRRTMREKRP